MLNKNIRKFAEAKNFTFTHNVAYGSVNGYTVTLSNDSGAICRAAIAIRFTDATQKETITGFLSNKALSKEYNMIRFNATDAYVQLYFNGKKTAELLTVVTDKLKAIGAEGEAVCPHCGGSLDGATDRHVLIDGTVFIMHNGCAERLNAQMQEHAQQVKKTGSVLTGTVGAILGGIVGSIPWAIAYYANWFVAWLGFLIGFAAQKGYELLNGKNTKMKAVVIALVSAVCVVLAQYTALCIKLMTDPDTIMYGKSFFETAKSTYTLITGFDDVKFAFIQDVALGWLFAGLGIYSSLRQISKEADSHTATPVIIK